VKSEGEKGRGGEREKGRFSRQKKKIKR